MSRTVVVQVGNSDDKLSQKDWALFCLETYRMVDGLCEQMHFQGGSQPLAAWQNACWVVTMEPFAVEHLRVQLVRLARRFQQDSIAMTVGETEFVEPDLFS